MLSCFNSGEKRNTCDDVSISALLYFIFLSEQDTRDAQSHSRSADSKQSTGTLQMQTIKAKLMHPEIVYPFIVSERLMKAKQFSQR